MDIIGKLDKVYKHLHKEAELTDKKQDKDNAEKMKKFVKDAAIMIDQVNAEISPTLKQCKPDGDVIPQE
jgi:hypothetical protein